MSDHGTPVHETGAESALALCVIYISPFFIAPPKPVLFCFSLTTVFNDFPIIISSTSSIHRPSHINLKRHSHPSSWSILLLSLSYTHIICEFYPPLTM